MIKRWVCLLAGSVILAACATPSQEQVERNVDSATAESLPEISDNWRTVSEAGPIDVGWVETFNDPVLSALVTEAQANNRDLAAAAAGVEQAQALARQAGANLSPDLNLSLGGARGGQLDSDAPGPGNTFTAGLQASWELDVWGRIRSGVAQSQAAAQAAEADYRFAQYSIAATTANAYFTAIEANLQTQVAKDNLDILKRTQRIVQTQYDEGVISAQDLALTNADIAAAEDQVATLEGASRNAVRALELLLGRYPAAELSLRETLPAVPPQPPAGLPSELLERRPDLIAAERQVAAAFNAVNQAKTARLPTVGLTGSLGGSSADLSNLLDPGNVAWSLGASLLAPIFDGGRLRENVNIATAEQEAALARYSGAALRAFSDVETALDAGTVLAQRNSALQESADQAAEAFRIAELRYGEGETSLVDLLTIQQRVINARSSLSTVRRLMLQQRVDLNLALGGSWE